MRDEDVKEGVSVILRKHVKMNANDYAYWHQHMDPYVGKEAIIRKIWKEQVDWVSVLVAQVDVDGGRWPWRTRDMELVNLPTLETAEPPTPEVKKKTKEINLLFDL